MGTYACGASMTGCLVALALAGAAPSSAIPTPVGSAQDVVHGLQARGFHVVVNAVADAPLDTCAVTAVRSDPNIAASDFLETTSYTTAYVDVTC